MKTGILGGTFNPIHKAHLELGIQARSVFGLDRIMVMPSGNSYFKSTRGYVTDAFYRQRMAELAVAGLKGFVCSDLETRRSGYTYTSDTLLQLTRLYPDTQFYFIIGADSLHTMRYWYAPEVILRLADIIVAERHAQIDETTMEEDRRYLVQRYNARIHFMDFEGMDISSTELREEISRGILDENKIPEPVCEFIRERNLYRTPMTKEEIHRNLKKRLKPSRYLHTLGVAETARELAVLFGEDPDRAELAGLIHDCGKSEGTNLTHGPIGARIARNEYGIKDEEILSAVAAHTTGHPAMSTLEKIIFIADYIEPGRDKAPRLPEMRRLARVNLDLAMIEILSDTIDYLIRTGTDIDNASLQTWDYYKRKVKGELS